MRITNKPTLVIPTALYVSEELRAYFGNIPPCLIPVNQEPTISHILEYYKGISSKTLLGVNQGKQIVKDFIQSLNQPVETITVSIRGDLGFTIFQLLQELKKTSPVIINFGDTIISNNKSIFNNNNFALFAKVTDTFRWTTFRKNKLLKITDKFSEKSISHNAFVGVFKFSNVRLLKKILQEEIKQRSKIDSFYRSMIRYDRQHKIKYYKISNNHWLDTGHTDLYHKTQSIVKERFFNTISIDREQGTIKKTSTDVNKFLGEIQWYLKLPTKLQYYVPRVFDYSLNLKNPYIILEYYGYSSLSELFQYANFSLETWKKIIKKLFNITNKFQKYQLKATKQEIEQALSKMYIDKVQTRITQLFKKQPQFKIFDSPLTINQKKYLPISKYLKSLPKLLKHNSIFSLNDLSVIHGDFCIANMLYDIKTNIIRIVDPRGSFGQYDIYGDSRYDLAKLRHSFNGQYEFIIADRFHLQLNKSSLNYHIYSSKIHTQVAKHFDSQIKKYYPKDYNAIKLIEALLFISMTPLHADHPSRQYIMFAKGIEKIHSLYIKLKK